uniref:DUF1828 domain-containing protein n=1 Tax=Roseihalotalea indica TaxID=2867963 RepID=A0AA49JJ30_9BACT|nr:DUF1828 domain-containing protein [Tunicatimonas sp. TK19036]
MFSHEIDNHIKIESLVSDYYTFLKDNTIVQTNAQGSWTQISTPLLDTFNDSIDIYAKQQNGYIVISDDGQTLRNLELSGVNISRSPKRKQLFEQVLINYGVQYESERKELLVRASEKDFPQKKFNLLSSIVEINNLYVFSKHAVASAFAEDVEAYLDEQQLIYTPHFISRGSTGLEFTFDFQIASRKTELVIKAFNTINSMNLPHFLFAWKDIKETREKQVKKEVIGLAIINDEKEIKSEYLTALHSKETVHILWSQRHAPDSIRKLHPVEAA